MNYLIKIDLFGGGKLNLHGNAVGMRTQAQEHKVKITVSMVTFNLSVLYTFLKKYIQQTTQ